MAARRMEKHASKSPEASKKWSALLKGIGKDTGAELSPLKKKLQERRKAKAAGTKQAPPVMTPPWLEALVLAASASPPFLLNYAFTILSTHPSFSSQSIYHLVFSLVLLLSLCFKAPFSFFHFNACLYTPSENIKRSKKQEARSKKKQGKCNPLNDLLLLHVP